MRNFNGAVLPSELIGVGSFLLSEVPLGCCPCGGALGMVCLAGVLWAGVPTGVPAGWLARGSQSAGAATLALPPPGH